MDTIDAGEDHADVRFQPGCSNLDIQSYNSVFNNTNTITNNTSSSLSHNTTSTNTNNTITDNSGSSLSHTTISSTNTSPLQVHSNNKARESAKERTTNRNKKKESKMKALGFLKEYIFKKWLSVRFYKQLFYDNLHVSDRDTKTHILEVGLLSTNSQKISFLLWELQQHKHVEEATKKHFLSNLDLFFSVPIT